MKSILDMLEELRGKIGTDELTKFESHFVQSFYDQAHEGLQFNFIFREKSTLISIHKKCFGD